MSAYEAPKWCGDSDSETICEEGSIERSNPEDRGSCPKPTVVIAVYCTATRLAELFVLSGATLRLLGEDSKAIKEQMLAGVASIAISELKPQYFHIYTEWLRYLKQQEEPLASANRLADLVQDHLIVSSAWNDAKERLEVERSVCEHLVSLIVLAGKLGSRPLATSAFNAFHLNQTCRVRKQAMLFAKIFDAYVSDTAVVPW